jgi:hypothetical protein
MPLYYDTAYWEGILGQETRKISLERRLQLVFSLLMFLQTSLAQFLEFVFTSEIQEVKTRASRFMGYTPSAKTDDQKFLPGMVFRAWLSFPGTKRHIHEMIEPVVHDIVKEESDRMIRDSELKVKMKSLTLKGIQDLLQPQRIMDKYREHAPFTWYLLYTFAASPNKWRKEKSKKMAGHNIDDEEDWEDGPNLPDNEPEKIWTQPPESVPQTPEGYSRNPVLVSFELLAYLKGKLKLI